MPCCKAEKYKWCKDLPVVDYKDEEGKEYCVFHAPEGKKGIYAKEFNELVFARIFLAKESNLTCELSGTIFEWNIHFIRFDWSNPLPSVAFNMATFIGEADFGTAKFHLGATFNGMADFRRTTFNREATFVNAEFNRGAVFFSAAFNGMAGFSAATFNGEAFFDSATLNREARFCRTRFNGEANFEDLRIKEKILFEGSDLKKVSFLGTDLRKIDFINCTWPKKIRRDVLYDEIRLFGDDRQPNPRFKGELSYIIRQEWYGFKKDMSCNKEAIKKVEILYRMLKQKYKDEHNDYEVSNWHYGEKEMFRKGSYFRRFFLLSLSNLYWFSSGYGERPVRAGIVLISLIFILSILTAIAGFKPPEEGFAAIILNTLQYATLQKATLFEPASLTGAYLKLLTQILIPLQTALFALAIKNRFKR